jgi:predicted RNA polymerase sigma factor
VAGFREPSFGNLEARAAKDKSVAAELRRMARNMRSEWPGAFAGSHAAIEKRITRAKKVLAGSKRLFDISGTIVQMF